MEVYKMNEALFVQKREKKIEIEDDSKKRVLSFGEYADSFLIRPKNSEFDETFCVAGARCRNGGLVRMPVLDGAGRSSFEWVFSGGVRRYETPPREGMTTQDTIHSTRPVVGLKADFSPHREYIPNPNWSLGSNTLEIEAKLRKDKKEEGYVEVERRGGKRAGAGHPFKEVI